MEFSRSLFYPTWRDACFFTMGCIIELITLWLFRKKVKRLPKEIKRIRKKAGHPLIAFYRWRGKGKIPKRLYLHGEVPKHSIRIFPPLHPGGRPQEIIDDKALELIYNNKTISEAWEILKDSYIDYEIKSAKNPEKLRVTLNDTFEVKRLYINFRKRIKRRIGQNYS